MSTCSRHFTYLYVGRFNVRPFSLSIDALLLTFFLKYMKFLDVTPHPMDYSCSRSDLLVRYYTIKPYTKEFHLLSIQAPNYVI